MVFPVSYAEMLSEKSAQTPRKRSPSNSAICVSSTSADQSSTSSSTSQGSNSQSSASRSTPPQPRASSPFRHHPIETGPGICKAQQIFPRMDLLLPDEPVAVDFEFQNFQRNGESKQRHRLGWIGVVNTKGESILDCFVRYEREEGVRVIMPPKRFGVSMQDLQLNNGAIPAEIAEAWLADIMRGRLVIVHGGSGGDLVACQIINPFQEAERVVDTQDLHSRTNLGALMDEVFPLEGRVQVGGVHTPIEDAQSTMKLYLNKVAYDRAAEKASLERRGLETFCKPSAVQTRQVQEMRRRHAQASHMFQRNANGRGRNGKGGRGGQ
ncbi:uncharacterized protein RCC_07219 [Ramularia collo-cygni]|uniref:Exonuclease domain-containing protein n=1 Tax=Ramularia collo-cygni TaxID=112498 RepID=A0A2D3VCC3_9PEZI|nr:uncharacterized protein RCC_07219 [Ramularia collo-cygni]CZT21356.1 uncharacterized protein RCC_07219 [Ramularia collo-cygni]